MTKASFCTRVAGLIGSATLFLSTAAPGGEGFKPLFTADQATSYIMLARAIAADTNTLVRFEAGNTIHMYSRQTNGSTQAFGYICTKQEHSDYQLRFEYKWGTNRFGSRTTSKRDAGVIFHMFGPDTVWPSGVELQVQEGDVGDIFTVNTRVVTTVVPKSTNLVAQTSSSKKPLPPAANLQFLDADQGGVPVTQGVAAGIQRVARNPMNEHEGWNKVEITVRSNTAVYYVNGKINNRSLAMERFEDGKWVPLTRGKIIFQLEGAEVFYRNIELKPLTP